MNVIILHDKFSSIIYRQQLKKICPSVPVKVINLGYQPADKPISPSDFSQFLQSHFKDSREGLPIIDNLYIESNLGFPGEAICSEGYIKEALTLLNPRQLFGVSGTLESLWKMLDSFPQARMLPKCSDEELERFITNKFSRTVHDDMNIFRKSLATIANMGYELSPLRSTHVEPQSILSFSQDRCGHATEFQEMKESTQTVQLRTSEQLSSSTLQLNYKDILRD